MPASAARATLADLLTAAGDRGERILIERRGKRAVAIVSVDDLQQLELLEARQAAEARDESAEPRALRRAAR